MEKLGQLAVGVAALAGVELQFSSPAIPHDLIQIPIVLQRVIQPHRLVLVMLIHPPIITAVFFFQIFSKHFHRQIETQKESVVRARGNWTRKMEERTDSMKVSLNRSSPSSSSSTSSGSSRMIWESTAASSSSVKLSVVRGSWSLLNPVEVGDSGVEEGPSPSPAIFSQRLNVDWVRWRRFSAFTVRAFFPSITLRHPTWQSGPTRFTRPDRIVLFWREMLAPVSRRFTHVASTNLTGKGNERCSGFGPDIYTRSGWVLWASSFTGLG